MALIAADRARERPDEIALRDDRVALGWAEVNDALNRVVNGLHAHGPRCRTACGRVRRERLGDGARPPRRAARGSELGAAQLPPQRRRGRIHPRATRSTTVLFVGPENLERGHGCRASGRCGHRGRVAQPRRRRGRCHRRGRTWLAAASADEPRTRRRPASEPDVHERHHRRAQGRRPGADDVRRRSDRGRAHRACCNRTGSHSSAPISWSVRCTTPVRCRACASWPPARRWSCSAGSIPSACCEAIDTYRVRDDRDGADALQAAARTAGRGQGTLRRDVR